ncbi:Zinc finger DNA binding protein [Operophtera brumata]|uniref:Zinc finger DNA binding protein n=1 Tax=Operophtera brumata TaxID=104452 RepID=A0A0L7LLD8_OPEBR|nr:Zinc finger DNA binding protein [Operophtera brumata]
MLRSPVKSGSDTDLYKKNSQEESPVQKSVRSKKRRIGDAARGTSPECKVEAKLTFLEERIIKMFGDLQEDIGNKFKNIETKLSNIQQNTKDIEKSMDFLTERFDEISKKVDSLDQAVNEKQSQIEYLEEKLEDLQRNARSSTLEIRNVPSTTNETKEVLSHYLIEMSAKVGVNVAASDIKDVFRIPGKADSNKPIIAEFTTTLQKNRIIKAVKTFNITNKTSKLNAFHLGLRGHSSPVFVVEHLTSKANRLHYLARELLRSGLFKYCWTSNGKVFMRKTDGSPIILIKTEEQLAALKPKNLN